MDDSYTPVSWDFRELIAEEISRQTLGKIFYFGEGKTVDEESGAIKKLEELPGEGLFVFLDTGRRVRIDRIITLFGKPGAAYDEYDAYANACLDCMGGYEKEDLDKL